MDERASQPLIVTVALQSLTRGRCGRGREFAPNFIVLIRRDSLRFFNCLERFFVWILACRLQVAAGVGRAQFDARLRKVIFGGLRQLSDRLVAG